MLAVHTNSVRTGSCTLPSVREYVRCVYMCEADAPKIVAPHPAPVCMLAVHTFSVRRLMQLAKRAPICVMRLYV